MIITVKLATLIILVHNVDLDIIGIHKICNVNSVTFNVLIARTKVIIVLNVSGMTIQEM